MNKILSTGKKKKVLLLKPPDRFLENEFVFQQIGLQYLQSYLENHGISPDILILYKGQRDTDAVSEPGGDLNMFFLGNEGRCYDIPFDRSVFEDYDVVGMSVASPQAPDAYVLIEIINKFYPHVTTAIGGTHPRYYLDFVTNLPEHASFDFIVPCDGWRPMFQIASGQIQRNNKSQVLNDRLPNIEDIPAPSRPLPLMKRYHFEIAGVPTYHTIAALGCPFSCNFCESSSERLRRFSEESIDEDLNAITNVHYQLGHKKAGVMFFDDVGLMNPKQVEWLSGLVKKYRFAAWRAFTHAHLIINYKERILGPFRESGGRRIGIGLETGSQRSLDLINKRNGKKQWVREHYEAVRMANELGIAVDAFTMIFPWEKECDLEDTTNMIEFIVRNPVNGLDEKGRPLMNHVDSTIMTPFKGTPFYDMILSNKIDGVEMNPHTDAAALYYKGKSGGSGWPYLKTNLPRKRYQEEQAYRNSLRPAYR